MIIRKLVDPDICQRAAIQARADCEHHDLIKNRLLSCFESIQAGDTEQLRPFSLELISDLLLMLDRITLLENHRLRHLERETYEFEREVAEKGTDPYRENWYRESVAELMLLMSKSEIRDADIGKCDQLPSKTPERQLRSQVHSRIEDN